MTLVVAATRVAVAAPAPAKLVTPDGNMNRADIPAAYKWELAPLFASDAAFDTELKRVEKERIKMVTYTGKLATPKALSDCLELYLNTRLATNKLTLYASMRLDSDQTSTTYQAMQDKALKALNALMTDSGFIRREVLALSDGEMTLAYAAEPKLLVVKPYLDEMRRRRARVLSPDAERALALLGDNLFAEIDLNEIPSQFEKAFKGLLTDLPLPTLKDEEGKDVQMTLSNYGRYRGSRVREVRAAAVEKLFATLRQYQHAFASTFAGQMDLDVSFARARGYDTALAAYLDKDNIDTAVFTNLIAAIHKNIKPLHDYVQLRKEVMALPEIRIYDLYPPMVPDVTMTFTYADALKVLPEALASLGPEYLNVLAAGMAPGGGWLDLYPHKNKESGAFSSSVYGLHPYVKMNYFNEYDDLSTLAHEYGHALHSHLSMTNQPYTTFNYTTFIAEIASTFNEKLLSDYMAKYAKNDDERLFILNHLVESIRTTIYRQTMFAEFEYLAHSAAEKGTPLTAEFLNATYKKLLTEYYGKAFTIGQNDDMEWAYIPHFYYKYYVYSYACGLSSGIALAERVQSGDPGKRDAYLNMLKSGAAKPPVTLLKEAGVDLTKPEAVEAAARLMQKTLTEMRTILKKKGAIK